MRRHAAQGIDIKYIHRTDRTGYKAGALDEGLKVARGEFVAIFDADFIAEARLPDGDGAPLHRPEGGDGADALGPHQRRLLAAHARSRHPARRALRARARRRNRGGCFFNFNGTAGIWRREAIADGGGWQHDTLTEDLDLSYRTQLRGWQFVFLPDHVAPAELPVEMNAFKAQQHRWAKGSIQTFLKLMPRILQSDQPFKVKAEAFFHLSANFNYPLMCVLSVLMAPSMVIRYNMGWYEMLLIDIPLFFAATASVANFYMVCQRELYPRLVDRAPEVPAVPDVDRHRPGGEQHQGRARGDSSTSRASSCARPSTASKAGTDEGARARSTARRWPSSRSSSWRSGSTSPARSSTRWPTASTAPCRS